MCLKLPWGQNHYTMNYLLAYLQDGTIGCESDVGDMYLAFVQGLCKFSKLDM
jgi:hypothetical protein